MKLLTIDIERPLPDVEPPAVGEQWVLVRLHGAPLGMLVFTDAGCRAAQLAALISDRFAYNILQHLAADRLCGDGGIGDREAEPWNRGAEIRNREAEIRNLKPRIGNRDPETWNLEPVCPQRGDFDRPRVTVAVCTRGGADRLAECLDAVVAIDYPSDRLELLVVENAPVDDRTRALVASRYPRVRYVVEPRPGLDWARNRAILEARGDILAFTDDDVSVDPGWVDAIARVFAHEPEADAVTGLVVPDAIDCEPERLFERYGGFGRGFERRYFRVNAAGGALAAEEHGGTGKVGTGANMAFRRSAFERIGMFDPALDVGTPSNGGGDLEMFFRVLKAGGLLVYEPSAIVRHRHRRTYEQLHTQLANHGIGFYAYLMRTARAYPEERPALMRLGASWFYRWNVRRLVRSMLRPTDFPRELILAEIRGSFLGLRRYAQSQRVSQRVLDTFGAQS